MTNLRGNNKTTRRDSPRGRYQGFKANAFNKLAEILNPEFTQTYRHTHANNSHLEIHNYLVYSVKTGDSCKAVPCFTQERLVFFSVRIPQMMVPIPYIILSV